MNIFPIKNNTDYQTALAEIDKLMNAEMNTPEGDALDIWVTLVESYEAKQFSISTPNSINAI
jgi:HTH-type transcriptional regulator/antitoxin HigA